MGSSISVIKTLIIPALISLIAYLLLTFLLVPLYTRYRTRYSYVPIPLAPSLDSISSTTSGLRARIQSLLAGRYPVPSALWRRRRTDIGSAEDPDDEDGLDFDEDGEELGHVRGVGSNGDAGRDGRGGRGDDVRRLSRDLEEGFMDDSDEEEDVPARSR